MTRALTAAITSARQIMNQGLMGKDLWSSVMDYHPNLDDQERKALYDRIASEHGVLGQVMFDPNLSNNCRQASAVKSAHPNKGLMVLTKETPYCDSCGFRKGSSCSLMGGEIVSSCNDIPEKAVHKVAALIESNQQIPSDVIRRIRTSEQSAQRRIAALTVARQKDFSDHSAEDVQAQIESHRAASILEPAKVRLSVPKNKKPRIAGTTDFHLSEKDQHVADNARTAAQIMNTPALTIDTSYISLKPREASIDASPLIEVPQETRKASGRQMSVEEEHGLHAQSQLNKMMRIAGRILGRGDMTLKLAGELLTKTEELMEQGGVLSSRGSKIAHQLEGMVGGTADIEGDLTD